MAWRGAVAGLSGDLAASIGSRYMEIDSSGLKLFCAVHVLVQISK
jgi:hypothetical protein